jgi:hypothetical protein
VGSRLLAITFLLLLFSLLAIGQVPGGGVPKQPALPPTQSNLDPEPPVKADADAVAAMRQQLEEKEQQQRVEDLKLETDKLLKLSVELKAYVDKTNTNILSVDVMKKAAEIEKLAKSVRDKMRGPN